MEYYAAERKKDLFPTLRNSIDGPGEHCAN